MAESENKLQLPYFNNLNKTGDEPGDGSDLLSPLATPMGQPTQFLIGGVGGAGVANATGGSSVRINDESVHPLQRLNPDLWNNIPVCLVKAVKALIDANISTDQRMRSVQGQTENNIRKATSHIQKIEKDLIKKEEQLKAMIERTDKHLSTLMNQKHHELESHIGHLRLGQQDIVHTQSKSVHEIYEKFEQYMDGEQIKEHVQWSVDQHLGAIRHEFKSDFFTLQTHLQALKQALEIPGLIGDNMPYINITDFLKNTFETNRKTFYESEVKIREIEDVQLGYLKAEVEKALLRVNTLNNFAEEGFKKATHKLDEELAKMSQIMKEQNHQMQEMNESLGTRLQSSDEDVQGMKNELITKDGIITNLQEDITMLRQLMDEQQTALKNMGTELAQCQQKVVKIDRAQASQAQMSMASFVQADRPGSRGGYSSSLKPPGQMSSHIGSTGVIPGGHQASQVDNNLMNYELDKLKGRILEVEKILMDHELTMKNLGDADEQKSASNQSHLNKKSTAKFDRDWTTKVDLKLSKLSSTIKVLTNKLGDLQLGKSPVAASHATLGYKSGGTIGQVGVYVGGGNAEDSSSQSRRVGTAVGSVRQQQQFVQQQRSSQTIRKIATTPLDVVKQQPQHQESLGTIDDFPQPTNFTQQLHQNEQNQHQFNTYHIPLSPPPTGKPHKPRHLLPNPSQYETHQIMESSPEPSVGSATKHLMKISDLIQTNVLKQANTPITRVINKPTVEDVNNYLVLTENGQRTPSLETQQRRVNLVTNLQAPNPNNGTIPSTERATPSLKGHNDSLIQPSERVTLQPISGQQQQPNRQTRTHTPLAGESMLATFSNNQQQPLYKVSEDKIVRHAQTKVTTPQMNLPFISNNENNLLMQMLEPTTNKKRKQGQTTKNGMQQFVNAPLIPEDQNAAFMQQIIRTGQLAQNPRATPQNRRITSSQQSTRQPSPNHADQQHQLPLAVKFEGLQQITSPKNINTLDRK